MQIYRPNLSIVSMFLLVAITMVVIQQTAIITNENRYLIISRIIS